MPKKPPPARKRPRLFLTISDEARHMADWMAKETGVNVVSRVIEAAIRYLHAAEPETRARLIDEVAQDKRKP